MRKLICGFIRFYQFFLSQIFGHQCCRFWPNCSVYAQEAISKYGVFKGSYLSIMRILRCHPWGLWGYDPVPND